MQVAQADEPDEEAGDASGLQHEHVAFGEVAHAPPKATLKRRHWDEAQAAAAHQARHKAVLLKHLRKAEAPQATLQEALQVRTASGRAHPTLLRITEPLGPRDGT